MVETEEVSLAPLLSDAKTHAAEYRQRNNAYEFRSVHPADTEAEVAKGWEAHKLGERSTRLRRPKSHDQKLEDRVWCLLYRMGYKHLNGERFDRPPSSGPTRMLV